MIAWLTRLLSYPSRLAKLRDLAVGLERENERLRDELAEAQRWLSASNREISSLNASCQHWRRLAAVLKEINTDLDTKLTGPPGGDEPASR